MNPPAEGHGVAMHLHDLLELFEKNNLRRLLQLRSVPEFLR